MKRLASFLIMLGLVGTAMNASAGSTVLVEVDSKTQGGFGPLCGGVIFEPDPSTQELAPGAALVAGQEVVISAVGEIELVLGGDPVNPNGITGFAGNPFLYLPLEEALVDSGNLVVPRDPTDTVENVGALMGAFISQSIVDGAEFKARNDDPDPSPFIDPFFGCGDAPPVGDISADALFVVGSGPLVFEAPEPGTLFLGVNDAFSPNNAGAFHVTLMIETLVDIDIEPGSDPNSINLESKGKIPVAILTTDTFDATQVNWETVLFGSDKATETHGRSHVKDADGDGDIDVVLHFNTQDTGILCDDTEATLTGETFDGESFIGSDSVRIVMCPE